VQSKSRRNADREHGTSSPHRRYLVGKPCDGIERVGQAGLECAALACEFQTVGVTPEQHEPEALFQQPHRSVDRSLSDIQLLRSRSEATVACRYLERA
jgi:hypothetical protein